MFGLIVRGDSLLQDGIADGDVVLVDPDSEPVAGSIEVVHIGDSLFPRVVQAEEVLHGEGSPPPDNPAAAPVRVGKVVWHLRRM